MFRESDRIIDILFEPNFTHFAKIKNTNELLHFGGLILRHHGDKFKVNDISKNVELQRLLIREERLITYQEMNEF